MKTQVEKILDLYKMESAAEDNSSDIILQNFEEFLEPSLQKYYLKIRKRRGTGIAILKGRTCSECRMVYPEAHPVIQCPHVIHKCEYCGRLIVASKNSDPEKPIAETPAAFLSVPTGNGVEQGSDSREQNSSNENINSRSHNIDQEEEIEIFEGKEAPVIPDIDRYMEYGLIMQKDE